MTGAVRPPAAAETPFDRFAEAYDRTHPSPPAELIDRIVSELDRLGVRRLAEIGMGTGRVAGPLRRRGIEVTGLDRAPGMLARARLRRLDRLVRARAESLPLRDGAVDGTLFVHLLHLLPDPARAIREAKRVARVGAFALIEVPDPGSEADRVQDEVRRRIVEAFESEGWPMPGARTDRAAQTAAQLGPLRPDARVPIEDRVVDEAATASSAFLLEGGSRFTAEVPAEVRLRVGERIDRAFAGRRLRVRVRSELAEWWSAS